MYLTHAEHRSLLRAKQEEAEQLRKEVAEKKERAAEKKKRAAEKKEQVAEKKKRAAEKKLEMAKRKERNTTKEMSVVAINDALPGNAPSPGPEKTVPTADNVNAPKYLDARRESSEGD